MWDGCTFHDERGFKYAIIFSHFYIHMYNDSNSLFGASVLQYTIFVLLFLFGIGGSEAGFKVKAGHIFLL